LCGEFGGEGETTFKEEFVTAGGVKLAEVILPTMQSRKVRAYSLPGRSWMWMGSRAASIFNMPGPAVGGGEGDCGGRGWLVKVTDLR